MRPYSRQEVGRDDRRMFAELSEGQEETKSRFPFNSPSPTKVDEEYLEFFNNRGRMGSNRDQLAVLEKAREYVQNQDIHPDVACAVVTRLHADYGFGPLIDDEFRALVLSASQSRGADIFRLYSVYVAFVRAEHEGDNPKAVKDPNILHSLAKHLDYLAESQQLPVWIHDFQFSPPTDLIDLLKMCKPKTQMMIMRLIIDLKAHSAYAYGYSLQGRISLEDQINVYTQVLLGGSKDRLSLSKLELYLDFAAAEAIMRGDQDQDEVNSSSPLFSELVTKIFSSVTRTTIDGPDKLKNFKKLLLIAHAAGLRFDPDEFVQLGIEEDSLRDIIISLFETKLNGAAGDAVRFAWYFEFLNLRNIPAALKEANFTYSQWLPQEVLDYARVAFQDGVNLDARILASRKRYQLSPLDTYKLMIANPNCFASDKTNFDLLAEQLVDGGIYDVAVARSLSVGASAFGGETMLRYANRVDLSAHDAYYFIGNFYELLKTRAAEQSSGEPSLGQDAQNKAWIRKVGKKLLFEVASDDAVYDQGVSQHYFAAIVQALDSADLTQDLARAKEYSNIHELQVLVAAFEDGSASPFDSWKILKKWYELHQLLQREHILNKLNASEVTPRMRVFVERLAFHPGIDMDSVLLFWADPERFLDIDDEHAVSGINEAKKPVNYLSLTHLNLTGADLRDAYVEGALDKLQVVPAMERIYTLSETGDNIDSANFLHSYLRRAIGRPKQGVDPEATNGKRIFSRVQAWCKVWGLDFQKVFNESRGADLLGGIPPVARVQLREIIFDTEAGMAMPKTDIYRIIIGDKSDPDMVVAGNDTASCMPFGSGKNNVYMFNPNCSQLVVQRLTSVGTWRTAAQSVVTLDMKTSRSTPDLLRQYEDGGHLKDLLSVEDLSGLPVLTLDNIEISKNDEGRRIKTIESVYRVFCSEYLKIHGDSLGVDVSRVVVGTGYTPPEFSFEREPNTYIPLAPMGYSDNVHEQCLVIETGLKNKTRNRKQGLEPLRTTDSLAVAVLEGKAYHDNESVITHLHHMQNCIIGKEIADTHFGRPNLSFMYRNDDGTPLGYILAYEGQTRAYQEVYIDDLAVDVSVKGLGAKLSGGRLINAFFDAYLNAYGDARPYLPIFMNARDQTSYQIVIKQAQKLAKKANLIIDIDEVRAYERGGDIFHDVRLFIGRTSEEINKQKESFALANRW